MNVKITPLETIEVSIRFWWLLVILMISGGIIGYLIFAFTPPVYESKAVFSQFIDYTKTEKMTDIEADQAIVAAGDIFLSKTVVDGVLAEAGKQGFGLSQDEFKRSALLERTNSEWTLTIRSVNADAAMRLVNIWALQSARVIEEGTKHAELSTFYHRQLESLARCVEQVPAVAPSAPVCGFDTSTDLQEAIKSVSKEEEEEANQSNGIMASLTINLINQAEVPGAPVSEGRNIDILAGVFLGFLFFIFLNGSLLARINSKRTA